MAKTTGSAAYYAALQRVFKLQSEILTRVLPHSGKRGSNDEARCRAFLATVLPRRYSVSSGFIVSSVPNSVISPEQDLVIFDDFFNSPLYQEPAAGVFPAEMVYATVEVKGKLRPSDLDSSLKSIAAVRRLAFECFYEYPRENVTPGRWKLEIEVKKRPPRSFIFAFDTTYKTSRALKEALEDRLNKPDNGAHLHGIVVVGKEWFGFQHVRSKGTPAVVEMFDNNGLLRFLNNMLESLKGVVVREAQMSRYLKIETAEGDPDQ
jgi:hypothetical protein